MACVQIPDLPLEEFGRELIQKWLAQRVPLSGTMELDLRCNLQCHHCYRDGEWPSGVLDTAEVIDILDQIADAGTIWLLFTGGEIFLRKDFFDIYRHARRRGLVVTLFTNGTVLTEKMADQLADLPPYSIELTLYGYSKEVYENVTGVPGSRHKCYRGVELLLERKLPLKLKTMVLKSNQHEFLDMFHFAEARGVHFKWDAMVNPNFDGSLAPCHVRLSPQEVVDLEFSVLKRVQEYREYFGPRKNGRTQKIFACGAGSRTFHIDPYGMMKMCLLLREPDFSLREMSFLQIWKEMFPPVYSRLRSDNHLCNSCNLIALCGKCAAWSQMEKGDMEARVEYSCEVGHRRAQALGHWDGAVDQYTKAVRGAGDEVALPVLQAAGECCR